MGTKLRPNVTLKILFKQVSSKEKKSPAKPPDLALEKQNKQIPAEIPLETNKQPFKKTAVFNLNDGIPMQISMEELKKILGQQAHNVGDRATLLDARDRLVRLTKEAKAKASSSIKAATTVLRGTCFDMCPEKERYSRAEKRRLAPYELLNSQVDKYMLQAFSNYLVF